MSRNFPPTSRTHLKVHLRHVTLQPRFSPPRVGGPILRKLGEPPPLISPYKFPSVLGKSNFAAVLDGNLKKNLLKEKVQGTPGTDPHQVFGRVQGMESESIVVAVEPQPVLLCLGLDEEPCGGVKVRVEPFEHCVNEIGILPCFLPCVRPVFVMKLSLQKEKGSIPEMVRTERRKDGKRKERLESLTFPWRMFNRPARELIVPHSVFPILAKAMTVFGASDHRCLDTPKSSSGAWKTIPKMAARLASLARLALALVRGLCGLSTKSAM